VFLRLISSDVVIPPVNLFHADDDIIAFNVGFEIAAKEIIQCEKDNYGIKGVAD
jgi:hypothetical protein